MNKKTHIFIAYPYLKTCKYKKEPYEQIILNSYLYPYLKIYNHKKWIKQHIYAIKSLLKNYFNHYYTLLNRY